MNGSKGHQNKVGAEVSRRRDFNSPKLVILKKIRRKAE
jgi:hypothetical protein